MVVRGTVYITCHERPTVFFITLAGPVSAGAEQKKRNTSVQTLFLAMALYPELQKKTRAEIDAVVRLPEFYDPPSLP